MDRIGTWVCAISLLAAVAPATSGRASQQVPEVPVRDLLDAGRYDDAEREARALVDARGQHDDASARLLVEALIRNGRGAEAPTLVLAKSLVREVPPTSATADDGASRRLLGMVLFEAGHYRDALVELEVATRIHERTAGGRSRDVAIDLEGLSRAAMLAGRRPLAFTAIERAVSIAETEPGDALLARALTVRGMIWRRRGEYANARADLERAVALRQRLGLEHPLSIEPLMRYGDQLWFDSDLARAREHLARALALATSTLRTGHPEIATVLRLQALVLDDVGDVDGAKAARERGLAIAAALGADHPLYALMLHELSLSYIKRGDYREARRLLLEALPIYERRLGRGHSEVGTTLHNLGIVAAGLGDFDGAVRYQRRAEQSWTLALGASHPVTAWAVVALGEALARQGRNAEALPILTRALATRERVHARDDFRIAATLNPMAQSLASLDRFGSAKPLIDRAVGIWEHNKSNEGLSDALLIRAGMELRRGDYRAAENDYQRALDVRLPIFGPAHPSIGDARVGLATTLAGLRQNDEALALALDGEKIGRDHIRLTTGYLPEPLALGYAASRARGLDLALSLSASPEDAARTFDAVIRGRSIVQDEMALRQRLRAGAAAEALGPLWSAVTSANRRLANLAVRGPGDSKPEAYAALLARAQQEKANAEAALADRSATARHDLERRDIGLDEVRASLPSASALVAFLRHDAVTFTASPAGAVRRQVSPAYVAFVLPAGQAQPTLVRLGRAATVDAAIDRWRQAVLTSITPTGEVVPGTEVSVRTAGARLRTLLWDPLRAALGDTAQVYLVPDGALNLVPFGALPIGRDGYLVDGAATIHYVSTERDLVEFASPSPTRGRGLLAVGGPAYGLIPQAPDTSSRDATALTLADSTPLRGRRAICGTFDTMAFPPLPASRREVEDVGALWRSLAGNSPEEREATILTGARANEASFKRSGPGHQVLHLATHGFFLGGDCAAPATTRGVGIKGKTASPPAARPRSTPPENPLLLSGVALAGANRRSLAGPDDEDGILTAEEVAALHLDGVEWAVLSACESGLGQIRGGEGVMGLRRAFRVAGARTVIMSLWPVDDEATRAWMRALYKARLQERRSTADAMRAASLTTLGERRRKGLSTHPFFWAGFVAAGDWH